MSISALLSGELIAMSDTNNKVSSPWYRTVECPMCHTQWIITPNNPCCIKCGHDLEGEQDVQVSE